MRKNINELFKIIMNNNKINFFSMHQNFRSIGRDLIIKSHPHENKINVENELKNLFKFVYPVFVYQNKLSERQKSNDTFIGFLYSNDINICIFIKSNNF